MKKQGTKAVRKLGEAFTNVVRSEGPQRQENATSCPSITLVLLIGCPSGLPEGEASIDPSGVSFGLQSFFWPLIPRAVAKTSLGPIIAAVKFGSGPAMFF